jgi:RNA polymerase sigma-70 factor (ECF subfamily)
VEADDFALMDGVKNGQSGAFEILVERYQRRLYRVAIGYLRNHEDALDAVQETLVKIYLARQSYRPSAHPFTWAARILANHCIDRIRHRRALPEQPLDEVPDGRPCRVPSALIAPDEAAPERQERRELGRRLQEAIFTLPPRQREIFILRHFGEMRLEEIAAARGCALGTVKSSLHRAAAALRDHLVRVDPSFRGRGPAGETS